MSDSAHASRRDHRIGLLYALGAFGVWGVVLPVYIKALEGVPVAEILAYRVVLGDALRARSDRRARPRARAAPAPGAAHHPAAAALGGARDDQLGDLYLRRRRRPRRRDSLGYFMNPLVSVALGLLVLRERLRPLQIAACAIAMIGVAILAAVSGGLPWIALTLALSFGLYGLVRKVVAVESLTGFTFEAAILTPAAAGYLLWLAATGRGSFALATPGRDALLLGAGVATALALIWFAAAARKLTLSTIGLLQFTSPSATFLLGVFVYGEPFSAAEAATFACVWLALLLYVADALLAQRRATACVASRVSATGE